MPFDVKTMFCEKLDVSDGGLVYSNVIDTGAPKLGDVEPIPLEIMSNKQAVGAGTVVISIQDSDDGTTWNDVITIPPKTAAQLAPGKIYGQPLPDGLKKKLRLAISTMGDGFTAGTAVLTAGLRARY